MRQQYGSVPPSDDIQIYQSRSEKFVARLKGVARWIKETWGGWLLAGGNGAIGYFGFQNLARGNIVLQLVNAFIQTLSYLMLDASAASAIIGRFFTHPIATLKTPFKFLETYHRKGNSWPLLAIISLHFSLRVGGAGGVLFNAIYGSLRSINSQFAVSLGAIIAFLQMVTTIGWEGPPWLRTSTATAHLLHKKMRYILQATDYQQVDSDFGLETLSSVAEDFLNYLRQRTEFAHIDIADTAKPIEDLVNFISHKDFISYCQRNEASSRTLRHDFYREKGIDHTQADFQMQHHFLKEVLVQTTFPYLIANMKSLLAFFRVPHHFHNIYVDPLETLSIPGKALTKFVSNGSFKREMWGNARFQAAIWAKARELDAHHVLAILAKYGQIIYSEGESEAQLVARILLQENVWRVIMPPGNHPAVELRVAIQDAFQIHASDISVAKPQAYHWNQPNDALSKTRARDELFDYFAYQSAKMVFTKILDSQDNLSPHATPSIYSLITAGLLVEGFLLLYQLTILASNINVIYSIAELVLGNNSEPTSTPLPAQQSVITTIATTWGYTQLANALFPGLFSYAFYRMANEIDKIGHRPWQHTFSLISNAIKNHYVIFIICLIQALFFTITCYAFASSLGYGDSLMAVFGIIGLGCSLIVGPTLLGPRIVEKLQPDPTDEDTFVRHILYFSYLNGMRATETRKFEELTDEAKHVFLELDTRRHDPQVVIEMPEEDAIGSSINGDLLAVRATL